VDPTRAEPRGGRDLADRQPRPMGFDDGPDPLPPGLFEPSRCQAEAGGKLLFALNPPAGRVVRLHPFRIGTPRPPTGKLDGSRPDSGPMPLTPPRVATATPPQHHRSPAAAQPPPRRRPESTTVIGVPRGRPLTCPRTRRRGRGGPSGVQPAERVLDAFRGLSKGATATAGAGGAPGPTTKDGARGGRSSRRGRCSARPAGSPPGTSPGSPSAS
jgi:hypothetical protein